MAPWISSLEDTLTPSSPRLGWLPFAISHPPLFHATLFICAVHLNRRRPLKDPSALLFYKTQAIHYANKTMNFGTLEEKSSDEMIITALCLMYFDIEKSVGVREYMVHLKGIERMVSLRKGVQNLGMKGIVRNWLRICHGPWSVEYKEGGF
jgi:Fungal specific transcription factor domain